MAQPTAPQEPPGPPQEAPPAAPAPPAGAPRGPATIVELAHRIDELERRINTVAQNLVQEMRQIGSRLSGLELTAAAGLQTTPPAASAAAAAEPELRMGPTTVRDVRLGEPGIQRRRVAATSSAASGASNVRVPSANPWAA